MPSSAPLSRTPVHDPRSRGPRSDPTLSDLVRVLDAPDAVFAHELHAEAVAVEHGRAVADLLDRVVERGAQRRDEALDLLAAFALPRFAHALGRHALAIGRGDQPE